MGTYPELPSYVLETGEDLQDVLDKHAVDLIGKTVIDKFNHTKLPYLPKVLSIAKALPLQLHPVSPTSTISLISANEPRTKVSQHNCTRRTRTNSLTPTTSLRLPSHSATSRPSAASSPSKTSTGCCNSPHSKPSFHKSKSPNSTTRRSSTSSKPC
jgi:hypothetical protein